MRHTYILLCSDNTLYTGISTDIDRRISEHNTSPLGAKYTRSRRPVQLIRSQSFETKSLASAEEYRIKHLTRQQKLEFIRLSSKHYYKKLAPLPVKERGWGEV